MSTIDPALVEAIEEGLLARGGRRTATGGIEFPCFNSEQHKHADQRASAWWSGSTRGWSCRACSGKGGALDAARRLGLRPEPRRSRETARWNIRDVEGQLVAVHIRLEPGGNGKPKEFIWQQPDGTS